MVTVSASLLENNIFISRKDQGVIYNKKVRVINANMHICHIRVLPVSKMALLYIDIDEIPGFFHLLKNYHIFILHSEDTMLFFTCEDIAVVTVTKNKDDYLITSFRSEYKSCVLPGNFNSIYKINRTLHDCLLIGIKINFHRLVLIVSLTSELRSLIRDTNSTQR